MPNVSLDHKQERHIVHLDERYDSLGNFLPEMTIAIDTEIKYFHCGRMRRICREEAEYIAEKIRRTGNGVFIECFDAHELDPWSGMPCYGLILVKGEILDE